MKKNLHISLLVFITVLAVLSCYTFDQYHSLPYQSYSSCLVTGLTYRGHTYKNNNIASDEILAEETRVVDAITGRNTCNFSGDPVSCKNPKGDNMIVSQVGRAGIVLVRLYFDFTKFSGRKLAKSHTISVSQKTGG